MGRPKIDIDVKQVEDLASFGCTNVEIASFFDCNDSTISKRFSRNLAKGRDSGKIRLRQKQFAVAMKGNVSMLIWLGKQILGQEDRRNIDLSNPPSYQLSETYMPKEDEEK